MLEKLGDGKTSLIAILSISDSMNYYYPGDLESLAFTDDGEYGYTVAEIVGWKASGKILVMRVGMGS